MTTVSIPVGGVALTLRLPGEWAIVPLDDVASARRAVRSLARAATGSATDGAALRSPLVRAALAEIERGFAPTGAARTATPEARRLVVARSIIEGVALPLSILVAPLVQPVTPARLPTGDAVLDVLELALAARDDGFSDAVRPELGRAVALRRQRLLPARPATSETPSTTGGAPPPAPAAAVETVAGLARLEVEHWLPVPDSRRVVRLLATTPVVGMDDVIVGLLDAIVRTARWEHPPIAATPSAAGPDED